MAIQLNERDELIFSLLDEHQVLLEKHIAWFISTDAKPVLIRDRLRKLFYLDYVLCQRHKDTLPWWTTPTKPLVYALSPMTRDIVGSDDAGIDPEDNATQRHLLEVANLRMLMLMSEREGQISNFTWTTCNPKKGGSKNIDAKVSFERDGLTHRVGILNNPGNDATLCSKVEAALNEDGVDIVWIVSRDEEQQEALQETISASTMASGAFFVTHQQLYKMGPVNSRWENIEHRQTAVFTENIEQSKTWTFNQAATA